MKLVFGLILLFSANSWAGPKLDRLRLLENAVQNGKKPTEGSRSWRSVIRFYTETASGDFFTCSGTFITRKVILTATHCVDEGSKLTDIEFFKGNKVEHWIDLRNVSNDIWINTKYNRYADEDYAFIRFDEEIMPAGYYPMRMADHTDFTYFNELKARDVYMIGASHLKMDGLAFAKGKVDIVYGGTIEVRGKNNSGICGGDSGGPLVIDNGRELVLVGVLSQHSRYDRDLNDECSEGGIYAAASKALSDDLERFLSSKSI